MDPSTKPGAGAAPHQAWRNRDYDASQETKPVRRRWLRIVAIALSLFMALGLLWGILRPLAG